jgi:uncharacterized protein with NAD-binding domain and iron-sulfur cluster
VEAAASSGRTKMAILGGGAGGLTAAFELTATPELRERYEVTVYQIGWRLGGKGASGRNAAAGNRIEEHGLHIWFGFYDNAFRVMRDAYEEWGRPPGAPLATFEDAFHPCDRLVLYDRQGDGWHAFRIDMPRNFMRPGDAGELPTFWEIADTVTRWALGAWRDISDERADVDGTAPADGLIPAWFADLAQDVAGDLLRLGSWGAEHLLELADRLTTIRARQGDQAAAPLAGQPWFLSRLLTGFRDWLWASIVRERAERDPDLRQFFTIFDVIASTVAGIVEDGVLEHGWDAVNDLEWAEWLRRHGAKEITLGRTPAERAPILRAVYDVAFGYPEGDISKADVAAGTATNDLLRLLFSYRGALMYKMQAGMGDVVFTPLYEVLRRRGVRFRFFSAVTRLGLAPEQPLVDTIEVVPQVDLVLDQYEPLVDVGGLPCWPSEPRWEELEGGVELRASGVDFEADLNPLDRDPITLSRGVDFDQVVLGIPVGALRPVCGELIERDQRWRKAIETAVTVQTQAFQVWLGKPSDQIGWEHGSNSVAGCYVEPLDTYCDMSHLLPAESWGEDDGVRGIAYFCGVLDERQSETPDQARERARENAIGFLERDAGGIWPSARGGPGAGAMGGESGFDWDLLAGRRPAGSEHRFSSQYWRANVTPSDRYVLTPAGSIKHRLPSNDSGFENLKLAGDWTKNGIDGGCVEAAATSGMQAARAITGLPRTITGQSPRWLQPRSAQLPPFVEFGGRATAPGPFLSLNGKLRSFVLEGDERRIGDLVRRTLDEPAGPEVSYRAVGSKVLLMLGGFEHVSSMASPFDRWGAVTEIMASLWVPVVAGRDLGDFFLAERFGVTAPYVLVDNPMSYAGGRETYGYAKTMGRFEPPIGIGDRQSVAAFGGNFGREEGAAWRPLFEMSAQGDQPEDHDWRSPLEGPAALMAELAPGFLERNAEGEVLLPGIKLAASLLDDVVDGKVRQVFLKQFRHASDGTRACYSSVVEAPVEIKRVVMHRARRRWDVKIHPLDSHPIGQELGLSSQLPALVLEGELDMVCGNGVEVGRISAPAPPTTLVPAETPTVVVAGNGEGVGELIRDAARLVGSELPVLRRFKWW